MPRTTLVIALTTLVSAAACGPSRASIGSDETETAQTSETGPPPDLPLDPPSSCVELDATFDLGDLRLCRVTPTGVVSSWDTQTGETVIHELVGLSELVELGRVDAPGCGGVLVHHGEADRIWLSDDEDFALGEDTPATLRVLDGAGTLLDTIELTHEGVAMTNVKGLDHAGRLVLAGTLASESVSGFGHSFVQVRDADAEVVWTQTSFVSPGSEYVTNDVGWLSASDTSLAFFAYFLFTDSFRISLHVLDAEDGTPRWDSVVAEDSLPTPYSLGTGPGERVYFGQIANGELNLGAHDDAGAQLWSQALVLPELALRSASRVHTSGAALYQLVSASPIEDTTDAQTHLVHRDLDGEVVCTQRIDPLWSGQIWSFELHAPTRALVGLHDPDGPDALAVLRVGWEGP